VVCRPFLTPALLEETLNRVEKFIVDNPNPHVKQIKLSYIVLAILSILFLLVIFGVGEEAIT